MTRAAYTPAALAERWECSERHVRNMIESGVLPGFRLGGKLLRVRAEEVEAFECQTGASPDTEENIASPGMTTQSPPGADVIALEPQTRVKQPASPRLGTRNSRARPARL